MDMIPALAVVREKAVWVGRVVVRPPGSMGIEWEYSWESDVFRRLFEVAYRCDLSNVICAVEMTESMASIIGRLEHLPRPRCSDLSRVSAFTVRALDSETPLLSMRNRWLVERDVVAIIEAAKEILVTGLELYMPATDAAAVATWRFLYSEAFAREDMRLTVDEPNLENGGE